VRVKLTLADLSGLPEGSFVRYTPIKMRASQNPWPIVSFKHVAAVMAETLKGDWSGLATVREFEARFKNYIGLPYALGFCNGTSAIYSALFALDLKPGEEVLVPAATFWASVVPILQFGALPVFVDCEDRQYGLDPEEIEKKITDQTRGIVVVHLWGIPSRIKEIKKIADKYGLWVLEDASHAHGAKVGDERVGRFGDISVFSFQTSKLCPAGEGGMALSAHLSLIEKMVLYGHYERIPELKTEFHGLAATGLGYKFRMSALSAVLGLVSLSQLDHWNRKRKERYEKLTSLLDPKKNGFLLSPAGTERVYYEYHLRYASAAPDQIDARIEALNRAGISAQRTRYPLLHQQPLFTSTLWREIAERKGARVPQDFNYSGSLPVTEKMA